MAVSTDEPGAFAPGLTGIVRTGDPDRLHELAPGWIHQSFQLGRGSFAGSLSFAQTSRIQFAVKDWSPGLLVRGAAPKDTSVLGFPLVDSPAGRICGLPMAAHDFGFMRSGEELDFRTETPFSIFILAMRQDQLEAYTEVVLGRPLNSVLNGPRFFGGRTVAQRQQDVERLGLAALYNNAARLRDPVVAGWIESRILDLVLCDIPVNGRGATPSGMATLARRAEDYLLSNLQAPLTVRDLCQAMNASERTLHLAFRQYLGTTPKAHLKVLRLNAARRELLYAPPGTGVMDVAVRWGFFHAGWFSQDYRRMFGESPSKALSQGLR